MKVKYSTIHISSVAILLLLYATHASAQISPPGLGKANTAFWLALGLRQPLDTAGKITSLTYVGIGRTSNPTRDADPFHNQAILVLNQEFYHQYRKNREFSYALSYRRQNSYEEAYPYHSADPAFEQEFRLYGRYAMSTAIGRLKWKNTLRQEFRKFFMPDFKTGEENYQFRTRIKSQLSMPLSGANHPKLSGSAELLFSISKEHEPQQWTRFGYRETRFTVYYTTHPMHLPFTLDIGYMNDLLGTGHNLTDVHYLAIDIIWERKKH
ncbi:Protein of unknown function [Chitinophaga jiangningensis]|uniref:DUF2490 domain-containing protein n=1 Tax=Chitinophaga jiangningensis TaxID=1419482 RepID=A0A1M7CUA8_9BACT|nr:DUF2490 domain-containing protein [Chitinophaga jiangningensis]SHL70760.1 Protein of unknown function [Chitinophaga jiangningensis]